MSTNPYKYTGPLDPVRDESVCVPRDEQLSEVISGIAFGEYWAILGPRQIGKSTFLRRLQHKFPNAHYIYFDFSVCPQDEKGFYQWLRERLIKDIPASFLPAKLPGTSRKKFGPDIDFSNFLKELKPGFPDDKKIVLLFDEIESIPSLVNFLKVWREFYHENIFNRKTYNYSVIITGSFDLVKVTVGETSPFNITKRCELKDFSREDSENLIAGPFHKWGIKIETKAKEKLISLISGHPHMFQQACHDLFEIAAKGKKELNETDVDKEIEYLLKTSSNLTLLKETVIKNKTLRNLLISIIYKGQKNDYLPYNNRYAWDDAGPIAEDDYHHCKIRNGVYEMYLKKILPDYLSPKKKKK
jgi:hypothetical protein